MQTLTCMTVSETRTKNKVHVWILCLIEAMHSHAYMIYSRPSARILTRYTCQNLAMMNARTQQDLARCHADTTRPWKEGTRFMGSELKVRDHEKELRLENDEDKVPM